MTGQCFVFAGCIVFRGIGPCDQSTVKWDWGGSMVTYRGRDWGNTIQSNAGLKSKVQSGEKWRVDVARWSKVENRSSKVEYSGEWR